MPSHPRSEVALIFPAGSRSYDAVRRRPSNILARMQAGLSKKLFPDDFGVRGDWIAVDYLTEALLCSGNLEHYHCFVEKSFLSEAQSLLQSYGKVKSNLGAAEKITVASFKDIPTIFASGQLKALFSPSADPAFALSLRNNYASSILPVVVVSHGFSFQEMLYDWFLRLFLKQTYQCDSIICTSRASQAAMARTLEHVSEHFNRDFLRSVEYAGRLDIIPLPVNTERFKPQPKEPIRNNLKLPKDSVILLYLGRISLLKADLVPLLMVFREILIDSPASKALLVIAGTTDAPYARSIETYVKTIGLSPHVRFIYNLDDVAKESLLACADIFVSPADSIQESFGLTPTEAMASGIPQVVADWNGYRDTVVHGETGFLVPTYWTKCDSDLTISGSVMGWGFDHEALGQSVALDLRIMKQHLQALIQNPDLRHNMSVQSRLRAITYYSQSQIATQYEALWSELDIISRALSLKENKESYETPKYFERFKGHPSSLLSDDCSISLTGPGRRVTDAGIKMLLSSQLGGTKTIDPRVVRAIVTTLAVGPETGDEHRIGEDGITLGALVDDVMFAEAQHHPDFVRRNVMWLMKYGFLAPSQNPEWETSIVSQGPKSSHSKSRVTLSSVSGSSSFVRKACRYGDMSFYSADEWIGRSLDLYGEWSETEVALFRQIIQPDDIVVEAGANVGTHTIAFAQMVSPFGKVLAYEPNPFSFELLKENVGYISVVSAFRLALGQERCVAAISTPWNNPGGAEVVLGEHGGISVTTLDETYELDRLALLKADVEGMELPLLKGAAVTIRRCRPLLYVEDDREERSKELRAWIISQGYRVYKHRPFLYNAANWRGNKVNVFGLVASFNLLCVPVERQDLQDVTDGLLRVTK